MKNIKLIIILLAFAMTCFAQQVEADQLSPRSHIEVAIRAAHDNRLLPFVKIVDLHAIAKGRHGMAAEELIELFKSIDPDTIQWKNPDNHQGTIFHMIQPLNYQFDLEYVEDETSRYGGYYKIVRVGP